MIPAQAVEAAARVMLDKMYDDKTLKVDDEDRDIIRAALEAAAPYMEQPDPPVDRSDPQCVGVAEGKWGQETRCGLKTGHTGECDS